MTQLMTTRWLAVVLGWSIAAALVCAVAVPCRAQFEDAPLTKLVQLALNGDRDERRDAVYEIVVHREAFNEETIPALAELTKDKDRQVRFLALLGLARAGPRAASEVDELVPLLSNRDDQVRFRAANALGNIGTVALPALLEAWSNSNAVARVEIARAIGIMGSPAKGAVQLLRDALSDSDAQVRLHVAEALVAVAPDDSEIALLLTQHGDPEIRCVGLQAIARHPSLSPAELEALQAAQADKEAIVREMAAVCMAKAAVEPGEKIAGILRALSDPEWSVRFAGLAAVEKATGVAPNRLATRLLTDLNQVSDPDVAVALMRAFVRLRPPVPAQAARTILQAAGRLSLPAEEAAEALQVLGPEAVSVMLAELESQPSLEPVVAATLKRMGNAAQDAILDCAEHPLAVVRKAACEALGRLPDDPVNRKVVLQLTRDADPGVRAVALRSALRLAPDADEVIAALTAALKDSSPDVRSTAVKQLASGVLSEEQIAEYLDAAKNDQDAQVRLASAETIVATGLTTRLRDSLVALAEDPVSDVRAAAVAALAQLPPESVNEPVRHVVVQAITDRDDRVSRVGVETAATLRLDDPAIINALVTRLVPPEERLVAVLHAIQEFGSGARAALPKIRDLLRHPSPTVRQSALAAVAKIETNTDRLVRELTGMLDDKAWEVRKSAAEHLGQLGNKAADAVPILFSMLADDEDSDFASQAIRAIDAAPADAIDLFRKHLDSSHQRTAFYAIFLLGKLGNRAKAALPDLKARLKEAESGPQRSEVRARFLRQAIESIEGDASGS